VGAVVMTALFDRLSSQDAGYLRRESPAQPMHFTISFVVEPAAGLPLDLDELRRHVAGRVTAAPWLRRKVKQAPGGIGPAFWVVAAKFTIERHVLSAPPEIASLPVADALPALTTMQLPRDRPLWQLLLHPADESGRTTLFFAGHHALSDGGLLHRTWQVLFGPDEPAPVTSGAGVLHRLAGSTAAVTAYAFAVRISSRLRGGATPAAAHPADPAPPRPGIYGPVGPKRVIAGSSMPLEDLRALRRATGATINDLFVAAAAAAVRDAVADRGLDLSEVIGLVPRNVRSDQEADVAGNRTATMLVPLPLTVDDSSERLRRVQEATARAKASEGSAGNAAFQFDIALSNMAYGDGQRIGEHSMVMSYAGVPLQGENRLVAAAASHNGEFVISYTADGDHFPDVAKIAERTFEEFRRIGREVGPPASVNHS